MKVSEVKKLFLVEFGRFGMNGYELRNTWLSFVEDLYSGGEINSKVYARCNAIAI